MVYAKAVSSPPSGGYSFFNYPKEYSARVSSPPSGGYSDAKCVKILVIGFFPA